MFLLKNNFPSISISLLCCLILLLSNPVYADTKNKPLEVTVEEAILMALENNSAFKIERLKPELRESSERMERSAFDVGLSSSVSTSQDKDDSGSKSTRSDFSFGISKLLLSGGDISLGLSGNRGGGVASDNNYSARISLTLSQPIFKGAGYSVNLAGLRKAQLSTKSSIYELQAYAETLISQVETACWDYSLAVRQLTIYVESLNLAQRQLDETRTMIDVGKLAEIELIASEAEVASRNEALINARSNIEKTRIKLLRLLNPPNVDFIKQSIVIKNEFIVPEFDVGEMDSHIDIALHNRPDLNQAELQLQQNELDVLTTKNGLLPNMKFFVTLGMTGYADSFNQSIGDIGNSGNDMQVGIQYTQDIGNRDSRERHRQSLISQEQSREAMNNLEQLAKMDVSVAWIELNRTTEQIVATAASRKLQEAKLRAETEKYRVGKSTSLLVAQAQRDLLASKISEIQAVANCRKAVVYLLRHEGVLLTRYGFSLANGEVIKPNMTPDE